MEWRPIKKYPTYEVNRVGEIRRVNDGRVLKSSPQKKIYGGYPRAMLYVDGVSVNMPVHRAVAEAFIPNPENKRDVHHIDGNPANNTVENLVWVTRKEHSLIHKKMKEGIKRNTIM